MKVAGKPVTIIRSSVDDFCFDSGYRGSFHHVLMANGKAVPVRQLLLRPRYWPTFLLSFRRGPAALLKVGVPGAHLRVKNNIRLFYPAPDGRAGPALLTAKVGLLSLFGSGSLARELRARAFIGRIPEPALAVPRVLRYDRRGLRWLEEEYYASSEAASERDKARVFIEEWAERFYALSARPRDLGRSLRWFRMRLQDVRAVCDEAGVSLPTGLENKTWPVALGHGDLSPGNMIQRPGGQLVVIDWEKFGRAPVAWDLKKLALLHPDRILAVLRFLSSSVCMEARLQLQVALAMQLVGLRRDRHRYLLYRREHSGLSGRRAEIRQAVMEADLIRQIRSL